MRKRKEANNNKTNKEAPCRSPVRAIGRHKFAFALTDRSGNGNDVVSRKWDFRQESDIIRTHIPMAIGRSERQTSHFIHFVLSTVYGNVGVVCMTWLIWFGACTIKHRIKLAALLRHAT